MSEEIAVATKRISVNAPKLRDAMTVEPDTPLVQCARLMHDANVGSLAVTVLRNGQRVPIGIVTDRDITIEVVAFSLDPNVITAGDIMARLPAP